MPGYIKFGDVDGKKAGFAKYDGVDGESYKLPGNAQSSLRQMGMSKTGISQLTSGKPVMNPKDIQIISNLVSQALR